MIMVVIGAHTGFVHLMSPRPKPTVVIVEKPVEPLEPTNYDFLLKDPPVLEDPTIYPQSSPKDYGYVRANRRH